MEPDFPVVQPWPIYVGRVNREEFCDSVRPPEPSRLSCRGPAYLTSGPSPCETGAVTLSVAGRAVPVSRGPSCYTPQMKALRPLETSVTSYRTTQQHRCDNLRSVCRRPVTVTCRRSAAQQVLFKTQLSWISWISMFGISSLRDHTFNTVVSTFRDWFRLTVTRPRGCSHPPTLQIAVSSVADCAAVSASGASLRSSSAVCF